MDLEDIPKALAEGNIEQLILYFPIFVIGLGVLILIAVYMKGILKGLSGLLPNLKGISLPLPRFKFKKPKRQLEGITGLEESINYQKEVGEIRKITNPTKAMDELSILINQYFSQLFDLHHIFTYEEIIKRLEKGGKIKLKEFCENLLHTQFSKNVVSKEELESIAQEFLEITKKYPIKIFESKKLKKRKSFVRLRRFKKELQREWGKGKNLEDKLDKIIIKTGKTGWNFTKSFFFSTKVPKTVSFKAVLEDIKKYEKKEGITKIFKEDKPTVEGFFYFIYLTLRKGMMERGKIKKIKGIIKGGETVLSKKRDVIRAQAMYNTIIPVYNSLSFKSKEKILPKIVFFYEEITNCMKFQKAMMYLLQLELSLKAKDNEKAKQFYFIIAGIYEQIPSQYKNVIYERFLNLEKEFNLNVKNQGGN